MTSLERAEALFTDDDKIYFFEWHYGTGHVPFGFHGTEEQFEAKKKNDPFITEDTPLILHKKEFCCTGKEQKEYLKERETIILQRNKL
jgi:hypothetical protein